MNKDAEAFSAQYLGELSQLLPRIDPKAVARAIEWIYEAERAGKSVFTCGNGGSSSIASQMVVDLVKGASYGKGRKFRAVCLSDSVPTLTALANDVSYDAVFVEPLKVLAGKGDVLVAVSGSGNSPNVVKAVEYANSSGIRTIVLTTSSGGRLKDLAQLAIAVPADHMGRLEDSFFVVTHILVYAAMEGRF